MSEVLDFPANFWCFFFFPNRSTIYLISLFNFLYHLDLKYKWYNNFRHDIMLSQIIYMNTFWWFMRHTIFVIITSFDFVLIRKIVCLFWEKVSEIFQSLACNDLSWSVLLTQPASSVLPLLIYLLAETEIWKARRSN